MKHTIVLIEALTFGLGRMKEAAAEDAELVLLTRDPGVYHFELANSKSGGLRVVVCDTFNQEDLRSKVESLGGVQGIVNSTDTWSLIGARLAQDLGLPHTNIGAVELARNKSKLRNILFDKQLSSGRSVPIQAGDRNIASLLNLLNFPLVLKDSSGTGSQNVWLIDDAHEFERLLATLDFSTLRGGLTAEPYFSGTLYSAEAITWGSITRVIGYTSRVMSPEPTFREEALALPVLFPEEVVSQLDKWISEVHRCIGYDAGFTHTEFVLTAKGPEIIEVNPRLAGALVGEALCQAFGVNIYEAFISCAIGTKPKLMDMTLKAKSGVGQALLYPKVPGVFTGLEGIEKLATHPGDPRVYYVLESSSLVEHVNDQRGCAAMVLVNGETSEVALLNSLSAASKLRVKTS
ncbi:MAG: ATP-grasp domain-containing protein [Beijerinckiaceae bacterium]|nr:ATP-grasp domain-containing protein [Beijerinckiaceae bacterium]